MHLLNAFCLKLAVIALLHVLLVEDKYVGERDRQLNNRLQKQAMQFPCAQPQKRALSVDEVLEDSQEEVTLGANMDVVPKMVVLHRCDRYSGCCLDNGSCEVKTLEFVPLVFLVFRTGQNSIEEFSIKVHAKNHTECVCESHLPK